FMAIEERTGICRVAEIAESMGVYTGSGDELPRVPTLTLGVAEVTPLAMANAYATFAAHGVHCEPRSILEVRDRNQKRLPVPEEKCTQVIDRPVADSVTELLSGVVDGPIAGRTGSAMSLAPQPVAGKTGTTNESAAVWFAGYTPHVAAAVWIGDPRGGFAYPLKDITINGTYYRQVFGGTLAGPIWKASMEAALADKPIEEFVLSTNLPTSVFDVNEIPDLTGMATPEEIFAALTKVNLELGEISEEDSPEPAGTVLAQTPEPGGPAVPETAVDIVVSTGLNTVPESRGAPVQDATTIMERAGYTAEIVLLETATVTPGLVMQQSVPAGTVAPVGSVILLTVSTPPTLVPQPEVPQPEVPQPAPDPAAPPVEDPAAPAPAP
ncbi:MAG: PASTA domain-containing protein, partial [Actinomycetota bacterium]